MADLPLKTSYPTIAGGRESSLLISGETHTVSSSYNIELVERPDETQAVVIPGLNQVDYMPTDPSEFMVYYRTGRIYFDASLENTEVMVTYYGWGTLLRDDHINTIQNNLNQIEHRDLSILNCILTPSGDVSFASDDLTFPDATLYLPNNYNNDDIQSYTINGSTETVPEGSVAYVTLTDTPNTPLELEVATLSEYAALSAATKLLAYRRSEDSILLWNGYVLADGATFSGFAAKNEIGEAGSGTTVLSGVFIGGYVSETGNPSLMLRSPETKTYTKIFLFAENTVGVVGDTIIQIGNGVDHTEVWLTSDGYYATSETSLEVAEGQFLTIRELSSGGHQQISIQVY